MIRKQADNLNLVDTLINSKVKTDYRREVASREPEMKQAKKIEKDRSWAVEKSQERSEFNNPIARGSSSVRPARCASEGGITNMGGPAKHVNVSGKNSIWDNDVLSRIANTASSKESTQIEKESSERVRQKKQAEYKQSMAPKFGEECVNGLIKSASTVSPVSAVSSGKGWVQANKLSMFDTNDKFDRLTALTERVNPKVHQPKKDSPQSKQSSKALSSKDVSSRFIDGIMDQEDKSNYKSVHDDSVERLYKVLAERNKGK